MKTIKSIITFIILITLLISFLPSFVNATGENYTITLNSSTESLKDRSFAIYKIFDVATRTENSKIVYDYTWSQEDGKDAKKYFTAEGKTLDQSIEYINSLNTSDNYDVLTNFAQTYHNSANTVATKTVPTDGLLGDTNKSSVEITGLDSGYYLIFDTASVQPQSAAMLVMVTGNTEVNLKAVTETIKKEIVNDTDTQFIGKVVDFKVTTKVPDTTGYKLDSYKFNIIDTLSTGLTYYSTESVEDAKILTIKVGDTTLVKDTDYTVNVNGQIVTIDLASWVRANAVATTPVSVGTDIILTYSATINSNAGRIENNKVELNYSNNPNDTANGDKVIDDEVNVYDYKVKFNKVNTVNTTLDGATFILKHNDSNEYVVADNTGKVTGTTATEANATVFTGGSFSISGLKEGTYELIEKTAPEGYKTATGLTFTITKTETTQNNATVISHTLSESADYLAKTTNSTDTFSDTTIEDGQFELDIINSRASILPETGSIGTTIFTIAGAGVMVTAVVAFIVLKKRNNN